MDFVAFVVRRCMFGRSWKQAEDARWRRSTQRAFLPRHAALFLPAPSHSCPTRQGARCANRRSIGAGKCDVMGGRCAFLISLMHHHQPALLHRQVLILDRLLTFLMAFSTLVLETLEVFSVRSHLSVPQTDLLEFWPLGVWQSLAVVVGYWWVRQIKPISQLTFSAHYIHSTGHTLSRPWSRQLNDVMSEIWGAQLHSKLFRRRHSTRQSHGLFALAKHLSFLFSLYICDFSVFTFCGVTLYCVAALLA